MQDADDNDATILDDAENEMLALWKAAIARGDFVAMSAASRIDQPNSKIAVPALPDNSRAALRPIPFS